MNPHQIANRERKTARLVEEIDRQLLEAGVDVHGGGERIAASLEQWEPLQWSQVAVLAAVHPPSEETIKAVLAVYRRRGAEAARRQREGMH